MCSISGIISSKHRNKISKMVRSQSHRAPDDAGVFIDENISLGMGRLKIIDLKSKISLPFLHDHFLLCFNGEIYNYIELKKELSDLGWVFKTHSDIEVLLKSWIHWGVKVFDKLNGMYAFSIYDKKKRKLWLARDIAGEKPLYYYSKNNDFLFASELKSFKGIIKLNQKKNDFYESFQHCLNSTLWENIFQIPAAHYLEYDINKKEMPWRKNTDPYRIWISEVMLQQTQVERVIPKYVDLFLDGKLKLNKLITHVYKLEDINKAFGELESGKTGRAFIDMIIK